jgi:hypothetical protein
MINSACPPFFGVTSNSVGTARMRRVRLVGTETMLLSAAYQETGRPAEAHAAMEKGMTLRPGSNLANVLLPPKSASAAFLAAGDRLGRAFVAAGLPER